MITCPKCSTSLNEGTKFCTNCGAAIEPANVEVAAEVSVNCLKCGATLIPGDKFCQNCGAPVVAAEVVEEVAAAQPATPVQPAAPAVTVTPTSETAAPAPLYPLSTPQGYRCPTCQAFLQPGSGFCASCGARFAQPVPYGGAPTRTGMNPAIPIAIAAVVLAAAAFGGWWFFMRGKGDAPTVATTGGTTTTTTGGGEGTTTGGGIVASDEEAAKEVALRIFNVYQSGDWAVIYNEAKIGDALRAETPDAQTFATQFREGMGLRSEQLSQFASAIRDVQTGPVSITGDRAEVPIMFSISKDGQTINATATARLVKDGDVWKLDLTGDQQQVQTNILDAIGMVSILQQMQAQGATTGSTVDPSSTSGTTGASTGDFQYTTGTTGMGTTGDDDDDF